MNRKILFPIIVVTLMCAILVLSVCSGNKEKARLSELDDDECIQFLTDMGVSIPKELQGIDIRKIISDLETNPDCPLIINWSVAAEFYEDVRGAIKQYYNLVP